MSKSALCMFICMILSGITCLYAVPSSNLDLAAKIATVVFFGFFVLAAAAGRRIRFDPVLR